MAEGQSRDPNRRSFARAAIRQPATVIYGDTSVAVLTVDVGQGGLSLLSPRPIGPGTRCTVAFELPFEGGAVEVSGTLKVIYSSYVAAEQFKIGTVFTVLDDETAAVLDRYTGDS